MASLCFGAAAFVSHIATPYKSVALVAVNLVHPEVFEIPGFRVALPTL